MPESTPHANTKLASGTSRRWTLDVAFRVLVYGGAALHGIVGWLVARKFLTAAGVELPVSLQVWVAILASPFSTLAWMRTLRRWAGKRGAGPH